MNPVIDPKARLEAVVRGLPRRRLAGTLFCPHRLEIFKLQAKVERLTRALQASKVVKPPEGRP